MFQVHSKVGWLSIVVTDMQDLYRPRSETRFFFLFFLLRWFIAECQASSSFRHWSLSSCPLACWKPAEHSLSQIQSRRSLATRSTSTSRALQRGLWKRNFCQNDFFIEDAPPLLQNKGHSCLRCDVLGHWPFFRHYSLFVSRSEEVIPEHICFS